MTIDGLMDCSGVWRPRSAAEAAVLALVGGACVCVCASPAQAGSFDVFGFGSRALSMGGAMTAASDDYTGVFYNTASLTGHDRVRLGVDLYTALPSLELVPTGPVTAGFEPEPPRTHSGVSLGVLFPFGGKVEHRVALGLGVHVPLGSVLTAEFIDPQVPQWYRYDTLPRKLHVAVGASYQPFPMLHLGVGAQILAGVEGGATVLLDLPDEQIPRRDIGVELATTAAPTAGLLLEPPVPGLRVGLNWRDDLGLDLALPILFDNGEVLDFVVAVSGISLYVPEQLAAGIAWDLRQVFGVPLNVALDVAWDRWSRAPTPDLAVDIDVQGAAVEGLGFEEGLDFSSGALPPIGFEDTLTVRAGLEAFVTDAFVLRAGYGYRPAAIAPQTGFSSFVDSDAHLLGAGGAVTVPDPLEIDENPVSFEVAAQYTIVEAQTVSKPAGSPVPGFSASGNVLTLCLTIRHDF